ncbi:hypothetical protein GTW43_20770 [Streptomyces sp. SID5785]|nr:hypothetical protein [Streptomyces sp. SID5785]MZD07497.1 hypothetical protein [Streptomyces sp. SID5785]
MLIGGTSHTGKSTAARAVADRLGFACLSTDGLARHPGRPWPTEDRPQVPPHVAEHYTTLPADALLRSVLDHYERLWPRVEELITPYALTAGPARGLVLEGSALWPERVARLTLPRTAAVWLTARPAVLTSRMHTTSGYDGLPVAGRRLVDAFLGRTLRYRTAMLDAAGRLGLPLLDTAPARTPDRLAAAVLDAARTVRC